MKYAVNKGFIVQKLGESTAIFDSDKSILYTFNETASYIFENIKKGRTADEIVKNIVKRYDIDEKRAKKDFDGVISDLTKNKIISSK